MKKNTYYNIRIGKVYRVTEEPKQKSDNFPKIGATGVCKWTSSQVGASLLIDDEYYIIPFECIEECTNNIDDARLIALITNNPKGAFKLLKGLWRMTKHKTIRDLMERGDFPADSLEITKINNKKPEEFDKQWEECMTSGAFASEVIS